MTWGMGGGAPGGFGRSAAPGLPFAGIPSELQDGVDRLLQSEPEYPEPDLVFTQNGTEMEGRALTLWRLLMEYPGMLALAGLLVVIIAVVSQAGPKLTEIAINASVGSHKSFVLVAIMAAAYLVSIVVTALSQRAQVRVTGRIAAWVMNDLRITIFTHLQRLSLGFFTEEKAGVIMSRMTSDIENLQQLLQDGLSQLAIQGLTMVVITVVLFTTNVDLAAITVFLIIPILVVASIWFKRASERGYDRVRDGIANVLADLSESLHGVRIVTAHNRQRQNVIHHRNVVGAYRDANNYTAHVNAVYGPGTQMLGVLGQAALLAIGGEMVLHHTLSVGALFAFFLYLNRFFQPIQLLVQQYNTYQQGQSSVTKLRALLETKPTVTESPDAAELPPIDGEIVFDHVSFGYDPDVPVIEDVDIRIAPGETVAFVGPTGAGKSTLAKLVTRFYDPTSGRVLIDGHDLRDVTMLSLRRQLGVVPQEPFLFAGTIGENIAFARPDAVGRRDPRSSGAGRPGRGDRPHAQRDRHRRPRAGADPVVGRAPTHRPGSGLPDPPPGAGARRGHVEPRPAIGDDDRVGPRCAAREPHRHPDRSPAVDRHAGRSDRGGGRRPGDRGRFPRRAPCPRRPLRRDVRHLDQPGGCARGAVKHPSFMIGR